VDRPSAWKHVNANQVVVLDPSSNTTLSISLVDAHFGHLTFPR